MVLGGKHNFLKIHRTYLKLVVNFLLNYLSSKQCVIVWYISLYFFKYYLFGIHVPTYFVDSRVFFFLIFTKYFKHKFIIIILIVIIFFIEFKYTCELFIWVQHYSKTLLIIFQVILVLRTCNLLPIGQNFLQLLSKIVVYFYHVEVNKL